jgi:hypothetical protein
MAELKNAQFLRNDRGDPSSSDGSTWVEFFLDTIPDEAASAAAGRQVWKEEERVRYYFPGNQTNRPVFKVTQQEIDKWPKQYEAFKAGHEMSIDGIPLEQWPVLKKSQVLELKALGFQTVEQIAAMNDNIIQKVGMGARELKNLAIAYLDDAESQALAARLSAENQKYASTVAEQNKKIEELSTLLNQVHSQLVTLQSAPSPVATSIPSMSDPMEAARMAQPQEPVGQSSLAGLAAPRRGPGRPRKEQAA